MDSPRDLDASEGLGWSAPNGRLFRRAWVRAVIVFAVLGAIAAAVVPWSLRVAVRPTAIRTAGPRPSARLLAAPIAVEPAVLSIEGKEVGGRGTDAGKPLASRPGLKVIPASDRTPLLARGAMVAADLRVAQTVPTAKSAPRTGPKPAGPAENVAATDGGEPYWVQVGAYRDAQTAKRVAQQLRGANFRVQESVVQRAAASSTATPAAPIPKGGPERYEVLVVGVTAEIEPKLAAKGLATRGSADGAVITPSLPLGEAVALSKDLTGEGLNVRVRRVAGATPAGSGPTETLHRVRVGGFSDRASALAALRDLETRGFTPFLTRGGE